MCEELARTEELSEAEHEYEEFVSKWAAPEQKFFAYPASALAEADAIVRGMRETKINMWIEELGREYGINDVLVSNSGSPSDLRCAGFVDAPCADLI